MKCLGLAKTTGATTGGSDLGMGHLAWAVINSSTALKESCWVIIGLGRRHGICNPKFFESQRKRLGCVPKFWFK